MFFGVEIRLKYAYQKLAIFRSNIYAIPRDINGFLIAKILIGIVEHDLDAKEHNDTLVID